MSLYTHDKRLQRIITELAEQHGIHPMDAAEMVEEFEQGIREFMKKGEVIRIPDYGMFYPSKAKIRKQQQKLKNKIENELLNNTRTEQQNPAE